MFAFFMCFWAKMAKIDPTYPLNDLHSPTKRCGTWWELCQNMNTVIFNWLKSINPLLKRYLLIVRCFWQKIAQNPIFYPNLPPGCPQKLLINCQIIWMIGLNVYHINIYHSRGFAGHDFMLFVVNVQNRAFSAKNGPSFGP